MNQQETTEFLGQVMIAFPGVAELLEKSPATTRVWCRTLESVSVREAITVLDRWITGDLKDPPVGFKRETLAIDVRSVVERMRSDEAALRSSESEYQANRDKIDNGRKPRGRNATPAADICRPFIDKVLVLNAQVINGTLMQQERDDVVAQLLDEAMA